MAKVTHEVINKIIDEYEENTPIFISEIKEYFDKEDMSKVYVYINRMVIIKVI